MFETPPPFSVGLANSQSEPLFLRAMAPHNGGSQAVISKEELKARRRQLLRTLFLGSTAKLTKEQWEELGRSPLIGEKKRKHHG